MSGKQEDYEAKCEEAISLVKNARQLLDTGNYAKAAQKYQVGLDLLDALLSVELEQRNLGPDTKKRLYYLQGHLERMRKSALAGFAEAQVGAPQRPSDIETLPENPPSYDDVLREDSLRRSDPLRAPPQYNDEVLHQDNRPNEQCHDQRNASIAGNLGQAACEEAFPDGGAPSAPPLDTERCDPTPSPQTNVPIMSPQPYVHTLPIHPHTPTSPQNPQPYYHSTPLIKCTTLPQSPDFAIIHQFHMPRTSFPPHSSTSPSPSTGAPSGGISSPHTSPVTSSSQQPVTTGSQTRNSEDRMMYPNLDYLHLEDTTITAIPKGDRRSRATTRKTTSLRISLPIQEILRINRGVRLYLVKGDGQVTCPVKDTCLVVTGPRQPAAGLRRSLSGIRPSPKRVLVVGPNSWVTNLSFDSTFVLYALDRYFAFKTPETKDTGLVILDVDQLKQKDKDQLAVLLKRMTFLKTVRKKGVATKLTTGLEKVAQKGVAATAKVNRLVKEKQPKFHLKTQKAREISVKAAKLCGSTLSRGMHSLADMVDNTEELTTETHQELYFAVENLIRSSEVNSA